jgi:hypothetical protein
MYRIFKRMDIYIALYMILFLEIINISFFSFFLYNKNYLPAPFILDKNDTLMDFYNPLFWAINDKFYSFFNSVYPPINLYYLKIFGLNIKSEEISSPLQLRADFPELGLLLIILFISIIWVVVNIGKWKIINFKNRQLCFIATIISTPVLFGIERGNLIFCALFFLSLHLNSSNSWCKAIFIGLAINFKPYFVIFLLPYLNIHRLNIKEFLISIFITLIIFFGSFYFVSINFSDFVGFYFKFSQSNIINHENIIALPHSLAALNSFKIFTISNIGSKYTFWFSLFKVLNYIFVIYLLYITLSKPLSAIELLISTFVLTTNFSISTGGYILIIYIVLVPYLIKSEEYNKLLYLIFIIFVLPVDWIYLIKLNNSYIYSYFSSITLYNPDIYIGWGSLIRPLSNFYIMIFFLSHLIKKYRYSTNSVAL